MLVDHHLCERLRVRAVRFLERHFAGADLDQAGLAGGVDEVLRFTRRFSADAGSTVAVSVLALVRTDSDCLAAGGDGQRGKACSANEQETVIGPPSESPTPALMAQRRAPRAPFPGSMIVESSASFPLRGPKIWPVDRRGTPRKRARRPSCSSAASPRARRGCERERQRTSALRPRHTIAASQPPNAPSLAKIRHAPREFGQDLLEAVGPASCGTGKQVARLVFAKQEAQRPGSSG